MPVTKGSFGLAIQRILYTTDILRNSSWCRSALTKNDLSFEVPGTPVKGNKRSEGSFGGWTEVHVVGDAATDV